METNTLEASGLYPFFGLLLSHLLSRSGTTELQNQDLHPIVPTGLRSLSVMDATDSGGDCAEIPL